MTQKESVTKKFFTSQLLTSTFIRIKKDPIIITPSLVFSGILLICINFFGGPKKLLELQNTLPLTYIVGGYILMWIGMYLSKSLTLQMGVQLRHSNRVNITDALYTTLRYYPIILFGALIPKSLDIGMELFVKVNKLPIPILIPLLALSLLSLYWMIFFPIVILSLKEKGATIGRLMRYCFTIIFTHPLEFLLLTILAISVLITLLCLIVIGAAIPILNESIVLAGVLGIGLCYLDILSLVFYEKLIDVPTINVEV